MRLQYYKRERTSHRHAEGSTFTSQAILEEACVEENVFEE
jgi:hypothetical protein